MTDLLSDRALNRATLARQLLLEKATSTTLEAVRHLYGLQAQAPTPPYFALFARLESFQPDELSRLIVAREVVRIVLMRGTVHLVTAADALELRRLTQPILDRDLQQNTLHAAKLAGLDLGELAAHGRSVLAERPLSNTELGAAMAERWPDRESSSLAYAVRDLLPLVQVPPRGLWGKSGQPTYATAEIWLGRPLAASPSLEELVRRYLAAYGPASVADVQTWSGLTKLGEVVDRIRPSLREFRTEDGRTVFDLPDAPRPSADTPAPVRLLGAFEQLLLSYADRSRVLSEEHRKELIRSRGIGRGIVLVDGRFRGLWDLTRSRDEATLVVELWDAIPRSARAEVEAEGRRLLAFAEPGSSHEVEVRRRP